MLFGVLRGLNWIRSGQIIATSHDLAPQNVAFWKGNPRLVKYYNLARSDGFRFQVLS